ncbi:MAG: DNA translocase FtsK [Anaerolineales bacterium]|jgi:S-DNA-T family DNA segregation ATPase FtsK/SpoIIIE
MPEKKSKARKTEADLKMRREPFYQMEEPGNDWLDRLVGFNQHFGRFARDAVGVILLASALMIVLGLMELSQGSVLNFVTDQLSYWLGWGSYLAAISIGLAGFAIMRWDEGTISFGRFLAFEFVLLLTLSLLAVMGGNSLDRATTGMDGGRVGWGLTFLIWRLAGNIWGTVFLVFLWLLAGMSAFGLWVRLEHWLLQIADTSPTVEQAPETVQEKVVEPELVPEKSKAKKKSKPLPPEFRKSLRVPESQDDHLAEPPPRSEDLPPLTILSSERSSRPDERTINQTAGMIEKTLSEFGIPATVIGFRIGPTVTQFAVQPGFIKKTGSAEEDARQMKVRVAQIAALKKDLALALSAQRLRIQAPVPGKPYVGIEVPNPSSSVVRLRPILKTDDFYKVNSPLAIALGRDVSGQALVADLSRMPHLLIAGATGSGKSVCITSIAACLAMNNTPEELRLVLIDSKMVELLRYNGLPHLYGKVETDIDRIMGVLRWVVVEMEHRYRLLEGAKSRDLDSYNRKLARRGEGKPLPRIVVIIDELADLMMSSPDQTEHNLVRLAQMARATGIHLVVATQRPSTDVVTGLIKANFPARLAFAVSSGIDSRVILDATGAETLLGRGDMLFLNPEVGNPMRAQGVMVTDQEIEKLITHWQKVTDLTLDDEPPWEKVLQESADDGEDDLLDEAISLVQGTQRASASLLQRRLRIGYPRAARLLDQLEEMGIVGPSQGGGRERDVLLDPEDNDYEDD